MTNIVDDAAYQSANLFRAMGTIVMDEHKF